MSEAEQRRNVQRTAQKRGNVQRAAQKRRKQQLRRIRDILICFCFLAIVLLAALFLLKGSQERSPSSPVINTHFPSESAGSTTSMPKDTRPPVLTGVTDLEAYVGEPIDYMANVTVTDDTDEAPSVQVDSSQVLLSQPGTYPVTYIATDSGGNTVTQTITLTLMRQESDEEAAIRIQAEAILADITNENMDDMQRAYAIYRWVKYNISYTGRSDKTNWVVGAHQAFTQRSGDCYTYFAAAKALLNTAGITNLCVEKSDTSHSSHYWNLINLGSGWYHFDCTPRVGDGDNFFMVTDAELDAYSKDHKDSHIFTSDLYPQRATVSVQNQVDYSSSTLKR